MMAKGVPVVCRIRDDLRQYYPADLPLINTEPTDTYALLENLLQHPETWPGIGRRGTDYVRREHEMHVVAERTLGLYERKT